MKQSLSPGVLSVLVLFAAAGPFGCSRQPPLPAVQEPFRDPMQYVNPFIGTGGMGYGTGQLIPGALVPFGMVKLSPDTSLGDVVIPFYHFTGYYFSDTDIRGFSHTHFVGTGGGGYGNIRVMPIVAEGGIGNGNVTEAGYRSPFRHSTETAAPGYYAVTLDRDTIRVELTATEHVGVHRYTFPATDWAYVLIDLGASLDSTCLGSSVTVVTADEIEGQAQYNGGMNGVITLYFSAQFNRPFTSFGVWSVLNDGSIIMGTALTTVGAYAGFSVTASDLVELAVGISYISTDRARANREAEVPFWGFSFDGVRARAGKAWAAFLHSIEVWGGTEEEAVKFSTALYHEAMMPTLISETDGLYRGFDGQVHTATGFRYYSDMSLWDTQRSFHPFMNLIDPGAQRDFVLSLMTMYDQGVPNVIPRWPVALSESGSMIGSPADIIVSEAFLKGVTFFDVNTAYQDLIQSDPPMRPGYADYVGLGYAPGDVSETVEYAHEDWALANLAHALGKYADEAAFRARSLNYKNLWDPSVGYLRAKNRDGSWFSPFDPTRWDSPYVEGDAIQWTWYAPQDPQGLMGLMGGPAAFVTRLEEFFDRSSLVHPTKLPNALPDTYYWAGNEPDIHTPYFFDEAGRPDRTQYWVREIMEKKYTTGPEGLAGNDDGGTISAWYIFSALGFYPQAGGDKYWVGSPVFRKAVVHMAGGDLTIITDGPAGARYVASVLLNGTPLTHPWFSQSDIASGGTLEFVMSSTPTSWGSTQ